MEYLKTAHGGGAGLHCYKGSLFFQALMNVLCMASIVSVMNFVPYSETFCNGCLADLADTCHFCMLSDALN